MSRTGAIRNAWFPQTSQEREAVLTELQQVLASPHFCNSKRYPALLHYIVEKTLAGEAEHLKERTLGVEVFDRPASYDTNSDTVVRYTAGEVRKRLSLYYHELDHKPAIQIALPVGSYVPEFLHTQEDGEVGAVHAGAEAAITEPRDHADVVNSGDDSILVHGTDHVQLATLEHPAEHVAKLVHAQDTSRHGLRVLALAIIAVLLLVTAGWRYRAAHTVSVEDAFWRPILHDESSVTVCIGGSVFSQTHLSGVATADKNVEYPFISLQSASAVAQLSALLEHSGATTQLQTAATTPLTALRDNPVILLGAYNNQWTMRLLEPLRFHFTQLSATDKESIVDAQHPGAIWQRNDSLPYSSSDDYALVARFRDSTTGSWVVVLAGVGRNGTEAAAHFATSPHYLQLLRDRLGSDFGNRNMEAVLKVSVIEGKTGAPSLEAVHAW